MGMGGLRMLDLFVPLFSLIICFVSPENSSFTF
jgi:hypothetical protein